MTEDEKRRRYDAMNSAAFDESGILKDGHRIVGGVFLRDQSGVADDTAITDEGRAFLASVERRQALLARRHHNATAYDAKAKEAKGGDPEFEAVMEHYLAHTKKHFGKTVASELAKKVFGAASTAANNSWLQAVEVALKEFADPPKPADVHKGVRDAGAQAVRDALVARRQHNQTAYLRGRA